MEEQTPKEGTRKGRKILFGALLVFLALLGIALIALKVYLSSPYPAAQLSRILSASLGGPVQVARLDSSGSTLHLRGIRIPNPSGFPAGDLLSIDTLAIAPDWWALITGKRSLRLVGLQGVRVSALQDRGGDWNFGPLQRHLAAQKPSPVETVIRHFTLKDGSVSVNGRGVRGIALEAFNLSTKGSRDSDLALEFQDAWRNRYLLKGRGRPGPSPALDVTLSAAPFTFDPLYTQLPSAARRSVRGGRGTLSVRVTSEKGSVSCEGNLSFGDLLVTAGGGELPLSGRLALLASYDQKTDQATVQRAVLTLDHLTTLRGSAVVKKLRGERTFRGELSVDEAGLERFPFLLPERERSRTSIAGKIGCRTVRLAGSAAAGVTDAQGALLLRKVTLKRDGRTLFAGLNATIDLDRTREGVVASGRATSAATQEALLQKITADFRGTFSPKLKPLAARVDLPSARVNGIDLSGRVGYRASSAAPFTVSAKVPGAAAPSFNPLLARYHLKLNSGTGSLSLEGAGRSAGDFAGTVSCRLAEITGSRAGQSLGIGKGSIESRVERKGEHLTAAGTMRLAALSLAGQSADAEFSYRLNDRVLTLEKGTLTQAGQAAAFDTLVATLPVQEENAYPVSLEVKGGSFRQEKLALQGISGSVRGRYLTDPKGGWLEGSALLAAQGVSWQGKEVAAPTARLTFTRGGGKALFGGSAFGGGFEGEVAYQPAVPQEWTFRVKASGAGIPGLVALLPAGKSPALSRGSLDVAADGSYSRSLGLSCRFQGTGKGIEVRGENSKLLFSDGGVAVQGALARDTLSLQAAEFSAGAGARLLLQGEVAKPFAPERVGRLTFSLPQSQVEDLISPFANMLPRLLQEATTTGALAAQGSIALHDGKELLEGTLVLDNVSLEEPAQKLVISGVKGKIPVSLDLAGKETGRPGGGLEVSRENYAQLLRQLQQTLQRRSDSDSFISIAKVNYGALDLGTVTMELHAGQGLTEIHSLKATIYDGVILGQGSVSMKKGGTFRVDLLASGVSMRSICNSIPNIKGYISGKIDGFLSVSGAGDGLKGLVGFGDLWAREGKGERMVVSKEFLQRLSKQKLSGFFFTSDRPYDRAEIRALLQEGDLSFQELDIEHTNLLGVRDLKVSIVPTQNRIALDHLLESIRQAATRGKAATARVPAQAPAGAPAEEPAQPEFKWEE